MIFWLSWGDPRKALPRSLKIETGILKNPNIFYNTFEAQGIVAHVFYDTFEAPGIGTHVFYDTFEAAWIGTQVFYDTL